MNKISKEEIRSSVIELLKLEGVESLSKDSIINKSQLYYIIDSVINVTGQAKGLTNREMLDSGYIVALAFRYFRGIEIATSKTRKYLQVRKIKKGNYKIIINDKVINNDKLISNLIDLLVVDYNISGFIKLDDDSIIDLIQVNNTKWFNDYVEQCKSLGLLNKKIKI